MRNFLIKRRSTRYFTVDEMKELLERTKELFEKDKEVQRQLIVEIVQQIEVNFIKKKNILIETLFGTYKAKYDNRDIYEVRVPDHLL